MNKVEKIEQRDSSLFLGCYLRLEKVYMDVISVIVKTACPFYAGLIDTKVVSSHL